MSWILHDPDEWETVVDSKTYGQYPGTDVPFGSLSVSRRRRAPEEVARIKAERQRKEEDEILRRADEIRARRAAEVMK